MIEARDGSQQMAEICHGLFISRGKTPTSKVGDQSNNSFSVGVQSPSEINDAHACGMEDVALQATRTRRSGSLCEP